MGLIWSAAVSQSFPPKSKFSTDQIPDLTGKIVIVTGGNTGIGKETVKVLLAHNAKVYMAARSFEKAEAAINELKNLTGKEAIYLELDLANLSSVRKSAQTFLSKETELHILFNNAGVMWPPLNQLTVDGYDLQFGVHVLAHHLLTKLLIPALVAGAQSSSDGKSRVISTSSSGAYYDTMHWDTLVDGPARNRRTTEKQYFQSKFAQVVWARELARRYADKNIVFIAVNPGNIRSELHRDLSINKFILRIALYPIEYGPLTQLYAGTSPQALDLSGKFLIPWARLGEPPAGSADPATGERLWNWLEEHAAEK